LPGLPYPRLARGHSLTQILLARLLILKFIVPSFAYLGGNKGSSGVPLARVLAPLLVAGADELVLVDHLRPVVGFEPLLALVGRHNL